MLIKLLFIRMINWFYWEMKYVTWEIRHIIMKSGALFQVLACVKVSKVASDWHDVSKFKGLNEYIAK